MNKVRTDKNGFQYEMTKAEAEEYFYGDEACEFGTPVPQGMWEALFTCPEFDERAKKEYLANHCYSPLVRQLILDSMEEGDE